MSLKVIVGLSGGVDSAVSAALLKRAGANVVGAFIKTWYPDPSTSLDSTRDKSLGASCGWREERRDAMRVSTHLDIPFVTIDLEKEYKASVVDYMISEYKAGRTPNPDVMCNKEVKFGAFLNKALAMGADMIATGHYCQSKMVNGKWQMLRGVGESKDQSYFLYTHNQAQLSKTIFPIGHLLKSEVRELAKQFKLPVAEKRDSQGICFLGHIDMQEFLSHYIKSKSAKSGDVLNEHGKKIGKHDGAIFYTLGQVWQKPYFVVAKNINENTISVSDRNRVSKPGFGVAVKLSNINWISGLVPGTKYLTAQVRYHGEKLLCHILKHPHRVWEKECVVKFNEPVLVAPCQSIVIYDGEICLGGGVVE